MISEDVRQAGLAAIAVAAATLVEEAHETLVSVPTDEELGQVLADCLSRLAIDLGAFAAAATVFARRD